MLEDQSESAEATESYPAETSPAGCMAESAVFSRSRTTSPSISATLARVRLTCRPRIRVIATPVGRHPHR
jgi:hypothetical protein